VAIVNDNPEVLAKEVCELHTRQAPKSVAWRAVTQDLVCNGYTAEEFARLNGSDANAELLAEESTS